MRSQPSGEPSPSSDSTPVSDEGTPETDGFTRHRCNCRRRTVLGSHGIDPRTGQYAYKIIWRDRAVLIYFGALTVYCRDCQRWSRVRVLPKEQRAEITPLRGSDSV